MLTDFDDSFDDSIDFDVEWPEEGESITLEIEDSGHIQIEICDEISIEGN